MMMMHHSTQHGYGYLSFHSTVAYYCTYNSFNILDCSVYHECYTFHGLDNRMWCSRNL